MDPQNLGLLCHHDYHHDYHCSLHALLYYEPENQPRLFVSLLIIKSVFILNCSFCCCFLRLVIIHTYMHASIHAASWSSRSLKEQQRGCLQPQKTEQEEGRSISPIPPSTNIALATLSIARPCSLGVTTAINDGQKLFYAVVTIIACSGYGHALTTSHTSVLLTRYLGLFSAKALRLSQLLRNIEL